MGGPACALAPLVARQSARLKSARMSRTGDEKSKEQKSVRWEGDRWTVGHARVQCHTCCNVACEAAAASLSLLLFTVFLPQRLSSPSLTLFHVRVCVMSEDEVCVRRCDEWRSNCEERSQTVNFGRLLFRIRVPSFIYSNSHPA